MQPKKYLTIIAIASVAISSCSKSWLTAYPDGAINEGNFYKSESDFQQAIVGAYVPLRDAANFSFYPEEARSDNSEYTYNSRDRGGAGYEQISDFTDDKGNGVTSNVWTADFKGIQRCDVILDRIAKAPAVGDSVRKQITGEAKGLRALYYYELVRLFGKLPLYLHEVTDESKAFIARSSVDSVYSQIIADATDALGLLKAPASFPQNGKVTKGTMATLLGDVYLTRKEYTKASDILKTVTTMGYDLLPDYSTVFKKASENSKESIFEVQYTAGTDGQSSSFIYKFTPVTLNTTVILGVNFNNTAGGWNVPTQDLVDTYEPNDKRLDATVGVVKGKLAASLDFVADSVTSILNPPTAGETQIYFAKKFYEPPYGTIYSNTDQNWPIYRYADVLLMLAEALNEGGQSADALPYLKKVRDRAGLTEITTTDKDQLRTIILHERRVELALENKRWFDLLRTGTAKSVMTAFGIAQKAKYSYISPNAYTIDDWRLIFPVPNREAMVAPILGQNDGY
jgi:hypothetical protein